MANINEISNELHKGIRKPKEYRKVLSSSINAIWSMDLVFMDKFGNENNGYKYILTVIDLYSRFAWAIALKNKLASSVTDAIQSIITKYKVHPQQFYTDSGTEFYNKTLEKLRSKYNIGIYSTYGPSHASVIERFNRTFKSKMYKMFTIEGNHIWYNKLVELSEIYNNSSHRGIEGKSPNDVFNSNIII